MVTAIAAYELEHVGVAAFDVVLSDADRLAPQHHCPPKSGLITGLHGYLLLRPYAPPPGGRVDVSMDVLFTDAVEVAVACEQAVRSAHAIG